VTPDLLCRGDTGGKVGTYILKHIRTTRKSSATVDGSTITTGDQLVPGDQLFSTYTHTHTNTHTNTHTHTHTRAKARTRVSDCARASHADSVRCMRRAHKRTRWCETVPWRKLSLHFLRRWMCLRFPGTSQSEPADKKTLVSEPAGNERTWVTNDMSARFYIATYIYTNACMIFVMYAHQSILF